MSLTSIAYFEGGELNLAGTDTLPVQQNLQIFIDKYEPDYLRMLLGDALYREFIIGVTPVPVEPATDPVTYEPIAEKWQNLLDVIFVTSGTARISPVANFIYFYLVRRATYYNSGTGLTQSKNENSIMIDTKIECSRAWCEMNRLSFIVYKFLRDNVSVYGPLPYSLRLDYLGVNVDFWFDWEIWWTSFPFNWRNTIPEIYRPITVTGI